MVDDDILPGGIHQGMTQDDIHQGKTAVYTMIYGKPKPAAEQAAKTAHALHTADCPNEDSEPKSRSGNACLKALKAGTLFGTLFTMPIVAATRAYILEQLCLMNDTRG